MNVFKRFFSRARREDVTRTERIAVWAMAAVLFFVALEPAIVATFVGHQRHEAWTGMNVHGQADVQVYLSYIDQVKRGAWLITNDFTAEPSQPYLSPVWLVVGLMARLGGLEPLTAFTLARGLAALLLAWAAHWAVRQFLSSQAERLTALSLLLFGTGLGWLTMKTSTNAMTMPIDVWVNEALPIKSALYTPHFVLAWALLLVVFAALFRAYRDGHLRDAFVAGLASGLLILFHPYHAPTILLVGGLTLVTMSVVDLRLFWKRVAALAIVGALTAPAVAYHWWLLRPERNGPHALAGNLCWTPAIQYVLIGFGVFVPLAIIGLVLWRRRGLASERAAGVFLTTWLVAQTAILYAPTMVQRRLVQGLLFPLAVFSGVAVAAALRWIDGQPIKLRTHYRTALLVAGVALFAMTSAVMIRMDVAITSQNRSIISYFTADESAMLSWTRQNLPPRSLIASSQPTGGFLTAWAGMRSYLGHWGQTVDIDRKQAEMAALYGAPIKYQKSLRDFLQREKIEYIYCGRRELRMGGAALESLPFLKPIHREGSETLYRVTE